MSRNQAQLFWQIAVVAAVLACLWMVYGCASATGGRTAREAKSVYREIRPDGTVIVDDSRDAGDVKQGSGIGFFSTPQIGQTRGDELGSIEFKGMKAGIGNVILGLFLFGCAVVAWKFLANPALAVVLLAAGVLSFLFPVWLGIGAAILAVVVIAYYFRKSIVQVAKGVSGVLAKSNGAAESMKETLAAAQDESTKAVIKSIIG